MPVSFVRAHQAGTSYNDGSWKTNGAIIGGAVAAGNLLVASFALETTSGHHTVTSISKPAGESSGWVKIAALASNDLQPDSEMWALKTTVPWPVGQAVVATTSQPSKRRSYSLVEFFGVDLPVRTAATGQDPDTSGQMPKNLPTASVAAMSGDLVVGLGAFRYGINDSATADQDTTLGAWVNDGAPAGGGENFSYRVAALTQHKIATGTGTQTFNPTGSSNAYGDVIVGAFKATNDPPNAPTLTSMAAGGTINRAVTNRASWTFSDPNPNDTQSAADVRYRQTGTDTWTTIDSPVPTQSYDFAGGTFAAAEYEWQVRTYDALGEVGPWSSSGFFAAVDAPAGPVITAPANGASVDAQQAVSWSTAQQDAYRLRKVADNAGAAVTGTVYYDTGVVEEPTTRGLLVGFPINNRAEHIQVQVRYQGVWSPWSDVLVDVSYTPPPTPTWTISLDPATGSALIEITNATPTGDAPPAIYNDVLVDDGDGNGLQAHRDSKGIPPNGTWRYWTIRGGRDYSTNIRVVAVAANGTTASS